MWADLGICYNGRCSKMTRDSKSDTRCVIFYCGSGWRSSLAWVFSQILGWENTKNYDGGWLEWSTTHPNSTSHPKEVGNPNHK